MQYCSLVYVLVFLPLVIFLYHIFSKKHKWKILLIASYIFFALLSGKLIVYLLFSTIFIHYIGLWISRIYKLRDENLSKEIKENRKDIKVTYQKKAFKVVVFAVLVLIGLLVILKYSKFLNVNINHLLELVNINIHVNIPKFLIPIGISFYTLQGLSYIFDVYKEKIKEDDNLGRIALFMAFFPCIMEGPIVRYSDTAHDLYEGNNVTYQNLTRGYQRILWGILKKQVVADRLNCFIVTVFNSYQSLDGGILFIGAVFYTIQLYMEFSGTMDIVIGSAEIFGVKVPENFRQPFFSKNISEFWTRWHITLGTWFRDYIFYPVSLAKPMKKLTLKSRKILGNHFGPLLAGSIALFAVWFCNGIWHGAAWMYIFFGLYHFFLIVNGNIWTPQIIKVCDKLHINREAFLYRFIQIIKTCILVVIGELFFRANGLRAGLEMFSKIIREFSFDSIFNGSIFSLGIDRFDLYIVIFVLLIVLIVGLLKEHGINIREKIGEQNVVVRWSIYYALILMIIIFGAYGPGYAPVDPIYANF